MEDTHAHFTNETKGQDIGYLLPNGERRPECFDRLGRCILVDISRIGQESALSVSWIDLPDDRYVHGCLTPDGAYAVFEASVATVAAPESTSPTP